MFSAIPRIEVSTQDIPRLEDGPFPLADSRPLHELTDCAPELWSVQGHSNNIEFPFSNDESARYFREVQARTVFGEYQQARNRTALLIGESALANNLATISEDTIILLDNSADMCAFMGRYVDLLREAPDAESWITQLADDKLLSESASKKMIEDAYYQAQEWLYMGENHVFTDHDAYLAAQKQAREKAIIPWNADITDYAGMANLAAHLLNHDATITMMNLSNVIPHVGFASAESCADVLRILPTTPQAPILATTTHKSTVEENVGEWQRAIDRKSYGLAQATGPFFGLDNLARTGGSVYRRDAGPIVSRQYAERDTGDYMPTAPSQRKRWASFGIIITSEFSG